jgi:hypothetical protein
MLFLRENRYRSLTLLTLVQATEASQKKEEAIRLAITSLVHAEAARSIKNAAA